MKLICMGTNGFAVPMFDALRQRHEIIAVYTRAPKPAGRKHILTKSPVHIWAEQNGIPVFHDVKEYNFSPDMVVVVSFGAILHDNVLQSAPCVNIHPSALPKYRGPSPIRTALFNGDKQSAVCLMQITPKLDAGDIYMQREFDINDNDTNEMVEAKVSEIGTEMLIEYLQNPCKFIAHPQVGVPTFTRKFTGKDEIIDWSQDAITIHNHIRALGSGHTKINGIDVKILETRVVNENLEIVRLQPAGKKPMDWNSFLNGHRNENLTIGK